MISTDGLISHPALINFGRVPRRSSTRYAGIVREKGTRRSVDQRRRRAFSKDLERRSLIIDLKRHARLAVAWSLHGSLVPRWT